jgi:hypothetical protein
MTSPPNKALQRRPRSTVHINIGVPHAAPLNTGVMRLMMSACESDIISIGIALGFEKG